jgi:hypothetical protein
VAEAGDQYKQWQRLVISATSGKDGDQYNQWQDLVIRTTSGRSWWSVKPVAEAGNQYNSGRQKPVITTTTGRN